MHLCILLLQYVKTLDQKLNISMYLACSLWYGCTRWYCRCESKTYDLNVNMMQTNQSGIDQYRCWCFFLINSFFVQKYIKRFTDRCVFIAVTYMYQHHISLKIVVQIQFVYAKYRHNGEHVYVTNQHPF